MKQRTPPPGTDMPPETPGATAALARANARLEAVGKAYEAIEARRLLAVEMGATPVVTYLGWALTEIRKALSI